MRQTTAVVEYLDAPQIVGKLEPRDDLLSLQLLFKPLVLQHLPVIEFDSSIYTNSDYYSTFAPLLSPEPDVHI
jgi:hypothetical protein